MRPRDPSDNDHQQQLQFGLDDLPPDEPVPFQLTATARRAVATEPGPGLRLVADEPPALPDPADPRRARARALRRSGRSVADIADLIDVDTDIVGAWTAGLGGSRRHLRVVEPPASTATRQTADAAFDEAVAAAYEEGRTRLASRQFVRGVALVTAAAEMSRHGVLVGVADEPAAMRVVSFLQHLAGTDPARIRVILRRVDEAPDLAAHRWAQDLRLPRGHVTVARTDAPTGHTALVRAACPDTAARLLGWRRALLEADDLDLDLLGLAF